MAAGRVDAKKGGQGSHRPSSPLRCVASCLGMPRGGASQVRVASPGSAAPCGRLVLAAASGKDDGVVLSTPRGCQHPRPGPPIGFALRLPLFPQAVWLN